MNTASDMLKINYLRCDEPTQMILREDLIGVSYCFRFFYPIYQSDRTLKAKGVLSSPTIFSDVNLFVVVGIYESVVSASFTLPRMSGDFLAVSKDSINSSKIKLRIKIQ